MRHLLLVSLLVVGCGPSNDRECNSGSTDVLSDPENCGLCGNACGDHMACVQGSCIPGECQPGAMEPCYTAPPETMGVGPCAEGMHVCDETATWSRCTDVVPVAEIC